MSGTSARLARVIAAFSAKLNAIKEYYPNQDLQIIINELLDSILDEPTDVEITSRLHRLRQPLLALIENAPYEVPHPATETVFNTLQLMTYIAPRNDCEGEQFVSIITREAFPDFRIYYSTSGYMVHYQDMHTKPEETVRMLSGRKLPSVEVKALALYMLQQQHQPASLLLNVLKSSTTKVGLQMAVMFCLVYTYSSSCCEDPSYLSNLNWIHAAFRMTGYPFEMLYRTVLPVISLNYLSEGTVSCIWNSFTNPSFMLQYYLSKYAIDYCQRQLPTVELPTDVAFDPKTITTELADFEETPQWLVEIQKIERFCENQLEKDEEYRHLHGQLIQHLVMPQHH